MSIVSGPTSSVHGHVPRRGRNRSQEPVTILRRRRRASVTRTPQEVVDDFWDEFVSRKPGKVTSTIPQKAYAEKAARRNVDRAAGSGERVSASYEAAAAQCRAKVAHIVKECRRVNQKYRDPHFDLELDLQLGQRDCLESLRNRADIIRLVPARGARQGGPARGGERPRDGGFRVVGGLADDARKDEANPQPQPQPQQHPAYIDANFNPKSVKRVDDIFDDPQFFIDGPTANDVRQGRDGDCWLMAALCTMGNKPGLIERVCVAHDAAVGVYGFVFHRDGEWFSEIIDDKLYLTKPDYDESKWERNLFEDRMRVNSEEDYRKLYQSNSGALYFAQCEHPGETWLPLLEKAYAKAHGDYAAIEGGFTGEGIEDLTGGVTSELYTTDILDKEYFWKEELMRVNDTFLFGCSTGVWGKGRGDRGGIVELHAYSVMRAVEMDGVRLVLLKNPWGRHEWKGPWSDGSKEWTAEWMQKLNHTFGDDGSFWISYGDLLRKYQAFDRTRLFGDGWRVARIWTTMTVPWTIEYNETKFAFSLARAGPVVLVLSQLDERYFRGLEGQYAFDLSFRLHKITAREAAAASAATGVGADEGKDTDNSGQYSTDEDAFDYVVRSHASYRMTRSVSVELNLDAGRYLVLVKIDAWRDDNVLTAEEAIRDNVRTRREKLMRIGLAYDLAHSKGRILETAEEKKARKAAAARRKAREKKRIKKELMKQRRIKYLADKCELKEQRKRMKKSKAKREAALARRRARQEEKERQAKARREADKKDKKDKEGGEDKGDKGDKDDKGRLEAKEEAEIKETAAPNPASPESMEEKVPKESNARQDRAGGEDSGSSSNSYSTDKAKDTPSDSVPDHVRFRMETSQDTPDYVDEDALDLQAYGPATDHARLSVHDGHCRHEDAADDEDDHDDGSRPAGARRSRASSAFRSRSRSHSRSRSYAGGPGRSRSRSRGSRPARRSREPSVDRGRTRMEMTASFYSSRPTPGVKGGGARGPQAYNRAQNGIQMDRGDFLSEQSDISLPESLSSLSDIDDDELELEYLDQQRQNELAMQRYANLQGGPLGGGGGQRPPPPPPPPPGPQRRLARRGSGGGGDDDGDSDPWNAVAVVGLRVYYQEVAGNAKQTGGGGDGDDIVKLWVERPHPFMQSEEESSETSSDGNESDDEGENKEKRTTKSKSGKEKGGKEEKDNEEEDGEGCGNGGEVLGKERVLDVDDSLKDATGPVQDAKSSKAQKERRRR